MNSKSKKIKYLALKSLADSKGECVLEKIRVSVGYYEWIKRPCLEFLLREQIENNKTIFDTSLEIKSVSKLKESLKKYYLTCVKEEHAQEDKKVY